MEKYQDEVVQTLIDSYSDDKELLGSIMLYLYHVTNDVELMRLISEVMTKLNMCVTCGSKLLSYEYEEIHKELEYDNVELFSIKCCPICDRIEIREGKYREV